MKNDPTRKHDCLGKLCFAFAFVFPLLSILTNLVSSSLEEMVTLVAGKEKDKKSFMVHKNILCEASPFFKAACKPEWMKPGKNYITMPEDDAKVVRIMIYWIYHDEICIDKVKHEKDINTCEKTLGTPWGLFARLYIVGQKYQMPRLQNDAVDALLHCNNDWAIDACIIPWIYNHTTKGDKLRKLTFRLARIFFDRSDLALFGKFLVPGIPVRHDVCPTR
ncbi:hypothetical protein N431DRAFT_337163 [Stipitochalara longipes BDJ]|nr:hypothetical protein N431DRAFT_337163 [Stipitochalara longipes BDJ]